jgi:hypothetical protein
MNIMLRMVELGELGRLLIMAGLMAALTMTTVPAARGQSGETKPQRHRVYGALFDPREHPDYDRRHVKPPSWETFGNRTHFAALRGFGIENDVIVRYVEEIEKYTKTLDLGDVVWPSYPIIFAKNLGDLADEIHRRGLFLFDIWGYVPGSGLGGYWQQYTPSAAALEMLESKLGDHWLGMDVGEQDGRYIGGYAGQMHPVSTDRLEQYLNFQRHFERMGDDLGNKLATLVSLNYGHYFLKEGTYTTIGAETAQGLPNGQVYYSFIRGAGKQYGVPWFGNASVWNRSGYKTYGDAGPDHGPTKGTSLNLLKRLMYSHILYNCVFAGFEAGWLEGDGLSAIGRIQQAAQRWVRENGQPGVMLTPVAVMVDFLAGWTFPRHLYTGDLYRVWGNLPYAAGDYLTDGVLDMLYPGYQNSSYFHDESGFIAPTPYGDVADCLLSDAPGWLLARYPALVVAGELDGGTELCDKLSAYVEGGGCLVITAGNFARSLNGLAGIEAAATVERVGGTPDAAPFGGARTVQVGATSVSEDRPFDLYPLTVPASARVTARCDAMPAAVEVDLGKGTLTVLASPFGVAAEPSVSGKMPSDTDGPLPKPYPLLNHVRAVLDEVFRRQMLFEAGEGLSLITCRKGPGEYTLGICNNGLKPRPFKIVSRCGATETVKELPLDQSEKGAVGYLPEGFEGTAIGTSGEDTIAGGDVRIFAVKVREENIEEIPHAAPPGRPRGRLLALRGRRAIKEEILCRPTFFEHFDGMMIDWRYVHDRDREALRRESGWLNRQGARVWVDLTSGINLYPDLRLVNNSEADFAAGMAAIDDVLAKMEALESRDLVLCLHRTPENNFTGEQSRSSFESTLKEICARAAARKIAVYLRTGLKGPATIEDALQIIEHGGASNLLLAPGTGLLLHQKADPKVLAERFKDKVGLWLVSAPAYDAAGALWTTNQPIADYVDAGLLSALLDAAPRAPVALDAAYPNRDEEYRDVREVERITRK